MISDIRVWIQGQIRLVNGGKEDMSLCVFVNSVFAPCKILLHFWSMWGNECPARVWAAGVELFLLQTEHGVRHTLTHPFTHTQRRSRLGQVNSDRSPQRPHTCNCIVCIVFSLVRTCSSIYLTEHRCPLFWKASALRCLLDLPVVALIWMLTGE